MIAEIIEKLKSLQQVFSEKFKIEAEVEELPKMLSTNEELLDRMKKTFIEHNDEYKRRKDIELVALREKLQEAETERERYEQQMDEIKTQREFEALSKEIRDATENEQLLRRGIQREDSSLKEISETMEREEHLIEAQEKELDKEKQKISKEIAIRKEKLLELGIQEKKLTPSLDTDLLFKFQRIIRNKEGEGIVPLRGSVCSGCQMILPNQFTNEVRLKEKILFCPYCSKVVFYAEEDEGLDHPAGDLADIVESFESEYPDNMIVRDIFDNEELGIDDDDTYLGEATKVVPVIDEVTEEIKEDDDYEDEDEDEDEDDFDSENEDFDSD